MKQFLFPKSIFIILLFITLPVLLNGQNNFQHQKDSLLQRIETTRGKDKLKVYTLLVTQLTFPKEELDLKLKYTHAFIQEAQQQKDRNYERIARRQELIDLYNYRKIDEFPKKATEHMAFFKKNNFLKDYYYFYRNLLQFYGMLGEESRSIEGSKQMYEEAKQQNYPFGIAQATAMMAQIYSIEDRHSEAETYSKETIAAVLDLLKTEDDQKDNYYLLFDSYRRLAYALSDQGKFDEATLLLPVWREYLVGFQEKFGSDSPEARSIFVLYYNFNMHFYINLKEYNQSEAYCDSIEQINSTPAMLVHVWKCRSLICENRKEYAKALEWIDKAIDFNSEIGEWDDIVLMQKEKARFLAEMNRGREAWDVFNSAFQRNDSLRQETNNAQLDELRTQYEVDKLTAQKERNRNHMLMALGGCLLLLIALIIYIVYSRQLKTKNRSLYQQIQERIQKEKAAEEAIIRIPEKELSREMQLFRRLNEQIQSEKLFTTPDINRKKLADIVGTNEIYLADAIREGSGYTFSEYIAHLRLNYALELLDKHPEMTLEAVAVDSGHGSYSPFFRTFGKMYGMSPSEYRKLSSVKNTQK